MHIGLAIVTILTVYHSMAERIQNLSCHTLYKFCQSETLAPVDSIFERIL